MGILKSIKLFQINKYKMCQTIPTGQSYVCLACVVRFLSLYQTHNVIIFFNKENVFVLTPVQVSIFYLLTFLFLF